MAFLNYDGLLYFWQKIKALLAGKVDKIDGKGLSTNDFTTAEKNKLAGLMNYIHPTTSGNKHIPAGGSANQILGWSADGTAKWVNEKDTTYSVMSGATVDADGKSGLVPSPTKGAQRWLDSTGAWTTPPDTTYGAASTTSAGLMSAADKKKLDGVADGANKYSLPTATSSVLGGVKTGANITNNSGVLSVTADNVKDALGYTPPEQDTNTWRPVVNSLTSSAADQSLAANQGKILNESKAAMIVLTNENLNDVVTPGFYSSGGSNSVTNKPSNVDHFGLIVIHRASGSYYTQIVYSDSAAYRRHCANGTWSGWVQDKLTDTDTWRGIQNNLTSDSTTDSLSAAQGKALKTLVDGKAAANHTHSQYLTAHQDISGKVDRSEAGANSLLATLTTTWTATPTDNTYFVRQDTGGGNTFGRVKFSTLWSYIKGKGDAIYQPKGSYAASNHTHTKAQVGLDNVDNTADANKSVKYATKAANADVAIGVADYNTPSKTIKIGYNGDGITGDAIKYIAGYTTGDGGSTDAKIKDVSKSALQSWLGLGNAAYTASSAYAASNHTHDDRYYTEAEIDAKLKTKADTHSHPYLPTAGGTVTGVTAFTNTTASTNKSTGAMKVSGGVGVAGRMSANEVMIGDGCTLRYDATNKCVNFTFS